MTLQKKKLILRILALAISLAVLAFMIFNEYGLIKYWNMKKELNQLDNDIRKSETRIKAMEAEIDSLKTSKVKIERVAREKFDMMKKNEKVFKIEEK
jgi:cell division protein FtsB